MNWIRRCIKTGTKYSKEFKTEAIRLSEREGVAAASGVQIDVQSGGKMSGYQQIGNGNTVTAAKGAELFWTDNSGNTSTLVGSDGFINPSSGSITIRGQERDAKYDITIDGEATIQQSTADGQPNAPLLIDDGTNLIINGKVTVAAGAGETTLSVRGTASEVKVNGTLIVVDANKVQGGTNVKGDPSKIIGPNGMPIQLTRAQLAMLRAGISLEEVLAATVPENETASEPEQMTEPFPVEPEATVPQNPDTPESTAPVEPAVPSEPGIPGEDSVGSEPVVTPEPETPTQNLITPEPPAEVPVTPEPASSKKPNSEGS